MTRLRPSSASPRYLQSLYDAHPRNAIRPNLAVKGRLLARYSARRLHFYGVHGRVKRRFRANVLSAETPSAYSYTNTKIRLIACHSPNLPRLVPPIPLPASKAEQKAIEVLPSFSRVSVRSTRVNHQPVGKGEIKANV